MFFVSLDDVPFYYANLLGYLRILVGVYAFWVMPTAPSLAILLYVFNAILDSVDGHLARKFDQCSRFGAILDQLTDRCTFLGLLMHLCQQFPIGYWPFCFQMVAVIDVFSHWFHLHASDLNHQKGYKQSQNWLINIYYNNVLVSYLACYGCEIFYLALLGFSHCHPLPRNTNACSKLRPSSWIRTLLLYSAVLSSPFAILKTLISIIQMAVAWRAIIDYDRRQLEMARLKNEN